MTTSEPCWGFHCSDIPPDEDTVVDVLGRKYIRHNGGWMHVAIVDGQEEYGRWMTEERMLTEHGPVRCPTAERMLTLAAVRLA